MEQTKRWILAIAAIILLDFVALGLSNMAGSMVSDERRPFTVSEVYSKVLLGEDVYVKGTVAEVLPEYKSQKGFLYQQFIISDGEEEIKIFCSEKDGKTEAEAGDSIVFGGKFQKYGNEYEIYGFCSDIRVA